MPVLHEYQDDPGFYVTASYQGQRPFTYQVSDRAADFFDQLGFSDGDGLPWGIVTSLRIIGDLYTQGEEHDPEPEDDLPTLPPTELLKLTPDHRTQLQSYLEDVDSLSPVQRSALDQFLGGDSDTAEANHSDSSLQRIIDGLDLPVDVEETVRDWLSAQGPLLGLSGNDVDDYLSTPGLERSLTEFARTPLNVGLVSLSGSVPKYRLAFDTYPDWEILDHRGGDSFTDFVVTIPLDDRDDPPFLFHELTLADGYIASWERTHEWAGLQLPTDEPDDYVWKPEEIHKFSIDHSEILTLLFHVFDEFDEFAVRRTA